MPTLRWLVLFALLTMVGIGGAGCTPSETAPLGEADAAASVDAASPSTDGGIVPVSLDLTPPVLSLAAGTSADVKALVTFSDRSTKDVTSSLTWTSGDVAIATALAGTIRGLAAGTATIEATLGSVSKTLTVTVTTATLVSLGLTPPSPSLPKGLEQALVATGTFTDKTTQNLTGQVVWKSANPAVATITSSGSVAALNVGKSDVTATLGAVTAKTTITVTAAKLASIAVTPEAPTVAKGFTTQLAATGTYTDGTTQDITTQVVWSSSAAAIATVNASGVVAATSGGSATISAKLGAVTGTAALTVSNAELLSIGVTPAASTLAKGLTKPFTATGVYSDATTQDLTTQVSWASTNQGTAEISNVAGSKGLATALAIGTTTITATSGAIASPPVTLTVSSATLVSIGVTPAVSTVAKGLTKQYAAIGTYTDTTTRDLTLHATWSSSDPTKASVSNAGGSNGLVSTVSVGSTSITATLGSLSGSAALTVSAAQLVSIGVTPAAATVPKGLTRQYVAVGVYTDASTQTLTTQVTWSSSDPATASISNAAGEHGRATTLAAGTTSITATLGATSGSTQLTVSDAQLVFIGVTPATASVAKGLGEQYEAVGTYTDGSKQSLTAQVTWSSSDPAIASIANAAGANGLATTLAVGTTDIRATLGTILGAPVRLTVTAAELVAIGVTPAASTVAKGLTKQYAAVGTYTDTTTQTLTTQVTWSTSDPSKASISNAGGSNGLATALAAGPTDIVATLGAVSGTTSLTVSAATLVAIGVTPAATSVAKGLTKQYAAVGTYTDATTQTLTTQVTWSSSDPSKASISNAGGSNGLATALAVGGTNITATLGAVSGSTSLAVSAAELVSIAVAPQGASVAKGQTRQFTAVGTYTDATTQALTTQVTWSSSDPSKASISNAGGSNGLASALTVGGTSITATLGTVSATTALTVSPAVLVSIAVSPTNPSAAKGLTRQLAALGTYSDATTADLTSTVTWASSSPSTATISNAGGSNGLATTLAVGTTTLSATFGAVSGVTVLTVTPATLLSIAVSPQSASVTRGATRQYDAVGTYTDASTQNLTTQVTWGSSDSSKATISNAAGSNGLLTATAVGTTTVTATSTGVTGSASLTITAPTLVSIAITPASPGMPRNGTKQLVATGTYSDTSTAVITTAVTWASSDPSVASISNTAGSQGLVTSNALVATTNITAALDGVTGGTVLSVVLDALLDSILTTSAHAAQINIWNGTPGRVWSLCYRRSRDGSAGATFHANCDAAPETIVIAHLNAGTATERLIGGRSVGWGGSVGYVAAYGDFLFSLTNNFKHELTASYGQYSQCNIPHYGPTFGGGHDFYSGSPIGSGTYCQMGLSYTCRIGGGSYNEPTCIADFCGIYQPALSDLEVFVP